MFKNKSSRHFLKCALSALSLLIMIQAQAAGKPPAMLENRADPVSQLAVKAVSGEDRVGKDGPMSATGFDLARLYHEHRNFKQRGGSAVLKYSFSSSNRHMRIKDEKVVIDAVASGDVEDLRRSLELLGMENIAVFGRFVSGNLPIAALQQAASLPQLRLVRAAYATASTGVVTSQGDIAQLSDIARSAFSLDGSGVVVGTLSDSYDCLGGAVADVASGDLPSSISVLAEEPGCIYGKDEGRAMMQIVHDVAPGASQAFHTAFGGIADFANGIIELDSIAGADVINDDVIYYDEPMFQDGPIAQAVDTVKANGVAYFSSAGNTGTNSYEDTFRDSGVAGFYPGSTRHDFDAGAGTDSLMQITVAANTQITIVLQWDDPFFSVSGAPGAATDIDLILYSANGQQALAGGDDRNLGGDAVEILFYNTGPGPTQQYQLGIEHFAGPFAGTVKLVFFSTLTIDEHATNSSTTYGHNTAAGARAVGAARYHHTPAFGTSPPTLEYFSSLGGTPILFDTAGNSVFELRQKPEFVAPDGGDNTFFGSDYEGNGFPNFFGTSAAAPHAAGVAALLKEQNGLLSPDDLYAALQSTAIDMDAVGVDFSSGYGLIQADAALFTFDLDADGVLNGVDNCPVDANPGQEDNDSDGSGDVCDTDDDNDSVLDGVDNCPVDANPGQEDNDSDGAGDVCDNDDDNDGLSDSDESIYGTNPFVADSDGDTLLDGAEVNTHGTDPTLPDTDGDGYDDGVEISAGSDPTSPGSIPGEATGDVNGDGLVNTADLLLMQQFVTGILTPTVDEAIRGDVAPLIGGIPAPDGLINAADYTVLTRKVLGDISF